jgi:hypothetical protein
MKERRSCEMLSITFERHNELWKRALHLIQTPVFARGTNRDGALNELEDKEQAGH